jgi:hypothetical protein
VADHGGLYGGTRNQWRADLDRGAFADHEHLVEEHLAPTSPGSFSTFSLSPAATRYCLPPVLMTANMGDSGLVSLGNSTL